jgi:hypothetical protein
MLIYIIGTAAALIYAEQGDPDMTLWIDIKILTAPLPLALLCLQVFDLPGLCTLAHAGSGSRRFSQ